MSQFPGLKLARGVVRLSPFTIDSDVDELSNIRRSALIMLFSRELGWFKVQACSFFKFQNIQSMGGKHGSPEEVCSVSLSGAYDDEVDAGCAL